MIKINLLPPELRKKKRVPFIDRVFVYAIMVLVGEVILLYLISLTQQTNIAELDSLIAAAQLELDKYQDKVRMLEKAEELRTELINRMSAVQELENMRAYWIQVLSEFASLVPEYLWVDKFEEKSEAVIGCSGRSYSLKAIAAFLHNAITSETFENVMLGPISQQKIGDLSGYSFNMTMNLKKKGLGPKLGTFVVDTAKADDVQKRGYKGFVKSTRQKMGLYGKDEAKKMFGGVNQ